MNFVYNKLKEKKCRDCVHFDIMLELVQFFSLFILIEYPRSITRYLTILIKLCAHY